MIRINKTLKSYSKINLFLSVGKKIKGSHLHNIQSLVFLINIYDKIKIQKNNQLKKDEVKFYGKFSSFIKKKNNSISKSFNLLRRKGYIKEDNFYKVSVYKKIPVFSGLGGGSSNSAVIAKFFLKKPINLKKNINYFSKHLGSDFKLFFKGEQIFQSNLNKIEKCLKKTRFYFIIVYPFIKSSTKEIYSKLKRFKKIKNKKVYITNSKKIVLRNLKKEENMLETIVVNKYPVIRKILKNLSLLNGCEFSRVTGSGSACFGLFLTKKMADKGLKKIKKKFPKFWCVTGKTI